MQMDTRTAVSVEVSAAGEPSEISVQGPPSQKALTLLLFAPHDHSSTLVLLLLLLLVPL
jgi:hypothetical protein